MKTNRPPVGIRKTALKSAKAVARAVLPWGLKRLVYRYLAQRHIDRLPAHGQPGRKSLLIINHHFDQDVRALHLANQKYNLVVVRADDLFKGAKIFFDRDVRLLHSAYPASDLPRVVAYRKECRLIFDRLRERFGLDLVITASDIFYWVREFIAVAAESGVRTLVLDKEGLRSPYGFREEALRVERLSPFVSDHLCVWSERQREFWKRVGVTDDKITVIGQPRSDLLFREKSVQVDGLFSTVRPLVTLFSYMDDAYLPPTPADSEKASWRQMKTETHDGLMILAEEFPGFNFVVKTHPQQPDIGTLQKKYQRENLRVIGGSDIANELLQRSELVIGFQTTAILEALYLGKPVVYTYWDPLLPRLEHELLPYHTAPGLVVVRSCEQFLEVCRRKLSGHEGDFTFSEETLRARDEFVNGFLHRPDGRVCDRFFDVAERMVR